MNKRDVIIIAVLLNTGLLSILAMMAINSDDQLIGDQVEWSPSTVEEKLVDNPKKVVKEPYIVKNVSKDLNVASDEWDSVLKDYVRESSSNLAIEDENNDDFEKEHIEEPKKATISKPTVSKITAEKRVSEKKIEEPVKKASIQNISSQNIASQNISGQNISSQKQMGKTIEICVKRGDALEKIARANGTTVEQIRALNNLKSDRLSVGQQLLIALDQENEAKPLPKTIAPSPAKEQKSATEVEYYVIKSGDNPWKIAKQYGVKFDDLLKLNQLDEEKARNLKIGDKIRVK